jgi:hypothetical protein
MRPLTCEWENEKTQKLCSRMGSYSVSLIGSYSTSNLFLACWQHVKKFRSRKFVEDSFGPGAKVEIRRDYKPKKFMLQLNYPAYGRVKAKTAILLGPFVEGETTVQDGVRMACQAFLEREKADKRHTIQVVQV